MKSMLYAMALMAFASFGYSQPTGNVITSVFQIQIRWPYRNHVRPEL